VRTGKGNQGEDRQITPIRKRSSSQESVCHILEDQPRKFVDPASSTRGQKKGGRCGSDAAVSF
jgi:hypothetical protein